MEAPYRIILRIGSMGIARDCRNLFGYPLLSQEWGSYGLQIWQVHSQGPSKKKHENFVESSCRRSQGVTKIFRAPIPVYRAHRAVIFAIAQLSCYVIRLSNIGYTLRRV